MEYLYVVGIIIFFYLFFYLKSVMWDEPRSDIKQLKEELLQSKNQYNENLLAKQNECEKQIEIAQAACEKQIREMQTKCEKQIEAIQAKCKEQVESVRTTCKKKIKEVENENIQLRNFYKEMGSNLTAFPYMAAIVADIETYGFEKLALGLSWGYAQRRLDKVKSIREIRKDARAMVEKNKEAQYQLAYLLELFPNLSDVIECDFSQLPTVEVSELSDYDCSRDYLSKDEYSSLSVTERNQLALDRYVNSHNKTKWQIGRDYEQYVSYQYRKKGYIVDEYGSYMGLEDLGRDLIAKKDDFILIIQCKYWSSIKLIHEKHITQLYGTMISYCIENQVEQSKVHGVLVTNIQLSDIARKMAEFLDITYIENYPMGEYPRIKCNIGHDEFGATKIYHLPFDQQYDITKIKNGGEFYAMTVAEAEAAGFRRTFKWFGNK